MSRTARQIRLLADVLDQQGKADATIAVIGTRGNLRKSFPPAKRGGALVYRSHKLRLVPRPAKGEPLPNLDWIGEPER